MLELFRMPDACGIRSPLPRKSRLSILVRRQRKGIRLQAQVLILALGAVAMANGQAVPSQQSYVASATATTPIVQTGVAIYRGQEVRYEIIDGMAVHDGCIVLGTVEEVQEEQRRLRSTKASTGSWPVRRDLAPKEDEHFWPDGIIPYVIQPGFTESALNDINEAIHAWNSNTVIKLLERTTEADYVQFRPEGGLQCQVSRRRDGVQTIWLRGPEGCGVSTTIHEIGHAVGLNHEHERHDRDYYVMVSDAQTYGWKASSYRAEHPGKGPYDYASVMHYGSLKTIPPGIPVRSHGLSVGDIDGVDRLYGTVPTATTITTNPTGLAILVDGQSYTTPVRFNWRSGTAHTLEVVSPQTAGGARFIFGRWSDEGDGRRTILADPDSTWYQANYIVQQRKLSCVQPTGVGGVTIHPASPDGFYVQRQPVKAEAKAAGSRRFLQWNLVPGIQHHADRRSRSASPAHSLNPATGDTPSWSQRWPERSSRGFEISESTAIFTASPTFLLDSNIQGIRILAGGKSRRLPWAFPADAYPNGIWVEAPETDPEELEEFDDIRYRFKHWTDGGTRAHKIRVPVSGGQVRLEIAREYRLRVHSHNQSDDTAVEILPPSEDGFYPEGTMVQVTATASQERRFAGWIGEISGPEPSQTVDMDSAKRLEAVFTTSEPLQSGETKSVTLRASSQFQLYSGSRGYSVLVPRDSSQLTVRFRSSSVREVDLYVHRGQSPSYQPGESSQTRRIEADFASASLGPMETITINRASVPRLANDVYFIALAVSPGQERVEGTLSVEVRRSGLVKARPRALAFVSPSGLDAAPQTVRLTYETNGTARYKIESDASWLMPNPREWVSSDKGVQEVSVMANTAGLGPDTHWASLSVLKANSGQGETTWTETGVEIPVTFAVVPGNGPTATSRAANAATIIGGPQEGETYGAGEQIRFRVNFADPVEVTGSPALNFRVGGQIRQVTWTGRGPISVCEGGYKSLEFGYMVQAEDLDSDGIDIPATGLTLNGGRIQTINGGESILALAGSLTTGVGRYKVDGSIAAVPRVDAVRIYGSPPNGVAYAEGESIRAYVRFTTPVEVDGSPRLALRVGGRMRHGAYDGRGSNGRDLWFRYEVQPEDVDSDGISIEANALTLNGGSIRSAAGADADLNLSPEVIESGVGHKVDGSIAAVPKVTRVGIRERPPDGTAYRADEPIVAWVRFSVPVETSGRPTLALDVGGRTRRATFAYGSSDHTILNFRYVVQAEDRDADGISISTNALALNGGSIRSAAGANADLHLGTHAVENAAQHKVDGSIAAVPKVTRVGIRDRPPDGTAYRADEPIVAWVRFSVPVETSGRPTLALDVGGRTRRATFAYDSSDRTYLNFRYFVQAEDRDADGISIPTNALALSGGSIRSLAGANADLYLGTHAVENAAGHEVDGSIAAVPRVSRVRIRSSPENGTAYAEGEDIRVYVRFTTRVEVDGGPRLALRLGGRMRHAAYDRRGGNGLDLWFRYEVQSQDVDPDGISIEANALTLNGGRIRSSAGVNADLHLSTHAITNASDHKVDGGG